MKLQCHRKRRKGAAVVEFALVLPIVVMLLLGCMEIGRGIMVAHALQEAAHAGCRVYAASDADVQAHEAIIAEAMTRAGIEKYSIVLDPPDKSQIDIELEPVSVTVSVDFGDVAWISSAHLSGKTILGRCTMPADIE